MLRLSRRVFPASVRCLKPYRGDRSANADMIGERRVICEDNLGQVPATSSRGRRCCGEKSVGWTAERLCTERRNGLDLANRAQTVLKFADGFFQPVERFEKSIAFLVQSFA